MECPVHKTITSLLFTRKPDDKIMLKAGLLARGTVQRLPVFYTVARFVELLPAPIRVGASLTATGIAPDLHRLPF
jgi:hypothetical protein